MVCQTDWIYDNIRNRVPFRIELMSADIWQGQEVIALPWPFPSEVVFVAVCRRQLMACSDGTKGKWPSELRCGSLPLPEHTISENMRHSFHLRPEETALLSTVVGPHTILTFVLHRPCVWNWLAVLCPALYRLSFSSSFFLSFFSSHPVSSVFYYFLTFKCISLFLFYGSRVTTAQRVLRLRMERILPDMEGNW